MKSLILYDSLGGNTEKVAQQISDALKESGHEVVLTKLKAGIDLDFFDYDLVFTGSPVIDWLPTKQMMEFIKKTLKSYAGQGKVVPSSPLLPGKYAVCFCTYGGPHIGKNEAVPMTMWLRSFFEHIGFAVLDRWHIVGQFNKETEMNTKGRLGNILGRPNEQDLRVVSDRTKGIIRALSGLK